jgi:hypothetical protein
MRITMLQTSSTFPIWQFWVIDDLGNLLAGRFNRYYEAEDWIKANS